MGTCSRSSRRWPAADRAGGRGHQRSHPVPTVRLRHASEYPEAARKHFHLSSLCFGYDFAEPPAMSRVMAWDGEFGGPHGRAMKRAMAPGDFTRGEKEMVAAVVSGVNACSY